MRTLGIDYGSRRVGLAVSDALGLAAHGLPTLDNRSDEELLGALKRIVAEREVGEIVVGLPLNMDGSEGEQAERSRKFAEALRALGRPVHLVDERLSTERAHRVMRSAGIKHARRGRHADRLAAQFILQKHLDTQRSRPEDDNGEGGARRISGTETPHDG